MKMKLENLLDDSLPTESFKTFLENFCKEQGLNFVVTIDTGDYKDDECLVEEKLREKIVPIYGEIATRICWKYGVDPDGEGMIWESLFETIDSLELPEFENPILAVYDEAGEIWPKPPAEVAEERELVGN